MELIKFRAWDKELQYMFYDIENAYDGLPYPDNASEKDYEMYDKLNETFNAECFSSFLEDERFVVMQCTGLKDKKGKEIYEGDIYKDGEGLLFTVVWYEEGLQGLYLSHRSYDGEKYIKKVYSHFGHETESKRWGIEVVENIHKNPELLEI